MFIFITLKKIINYNFITIPSFIYFYFLFNYSQMLLIYFIVPVI
jgi:hypothetical protein